MVDWIRIRILKKCNHRDQHKPCISFYEIGIFVFIDLILLYIDIIICFLFTCLLSYYRSCVQKPIIDLDFTYLCSQISKVSIFLRLFGEFSFKDIFLSSWKVVHKTTITKRNQYLRMLSNNILEAQGKKPFVIKLESSLLYSNKKLFTVYMFGNFNYNYIDTSHHTRSMWIF